MLPLFFLFAGIVSAQATFNVPVIDAAITGEPRIYYATTGAGLFRSTDDGVTWRSLALRPRGQRQPNVSGIQVHPANRLVAYATTDTADGSLWRTTDGGETWTTWSSGLPQTGGAFDSFTILGGGAASLMYGRVGDVIFKSVNGGETWTRQATQPVVGGTLAVNPRNPAFMLLGISAGMYRSNDEGANWFLFPSLKIPSGANVTSILIDPFLPDTAYVGTSSVDGATGGFYISTTAGPNSPEAGLGLVEPRIRPLTVYGPATRPYNLFSTEAVCPSLQGRPTACIGKSTDNGRGWRLLGVDVGFASQVRLGFHPGLFTTMVAATQRGVYLSTDAGENWQSKIGRALPTLSLPPPIEFNLPPGGVGRIDNVVRVVESDRWFLPVTTVSSGEPWLTVTGGNGATPLTLQVSVNAEGLAPGTYTASIRVNSPDAINNGETIPVRLTVTPPAAPLVSHVLNTIAGTGQAGNFGDNGPATRAVIGNPDSLTFDDEGNLYVSTPVTNVVRRIAPNGRITRFAGNGQSGFAGDNGQALLATFNGPRGLAFGFSRVFVADSDNNRIRFATTDSEQLQSYADAGVERPRGLAFDEQGNLYAALPSQHVVVRIDTNRRVSVVAGARGQSGFRGDGVAASAALLSAPLDVAVGPGGIVYIADTDNHRIRAVDPNGRIRTVAGNGLGGFQGDTDVATATALNRPSGVAVTADGNVIIGDTDNHRIRLLTPTGAIRTIAGTGAAGFAGDEGDAVRGQLRSPTDIAVDAQGVIHFSDTQNNRIRTLTPQARSTAPAISEGGVVNSADLTARLAPGSLFTILGVNFAAETATADGTPWPAVLGGVTVTFDGKPAVLSSVAPGQISGQIPWDAAGSIDVVVNVNGVDSRPAPVTVASTAPAIFQPTRGRAFAINEDGSQNSAASPAAPGSMVTLRFTGQGAVDNRPEAGAVAAEDPVSQPVETVSVTVRDRVDAVTARLTPGQVGVAEVRFRVPQLPAGDHPAVVTVGGSSSGSALIAVR